ncbi:MAG: hypothetical protein IPM98_16190 [Lewinellaceae bacterium]|nr:hypothetical protein [Lewinellaceae bacterium]
MHSRIILKVELSKNGGNMRVLWVGGSRRVLHLFDPLGRQRMPEKTASSNSFASAEMKIPSVY